MEDRLRPLPLKLFQASFRPHENQTTVVDLVKDPAP
jgi:hypothetical protein